MKLQNDIVYVFENFLRSEVCEHYLKTIKDIGYKENNLPFEERTQDITKDPIGDLVKDFLRKNIDINITLHQAQTQNWHINSFSKLHKHNHSGRENTQYNSLIYLNDDFEGGEFITDGGLILKPKQGMLTFFDGHAIKHGTNKVFKRDRKTLIFWWKEV